MNGHENTLLLIAQSISVGFALVTIRYLADRDKGRPLSERVKIQERRFVSGSPQFNARSPSFRPDTWNLRVTNGQGQGWVRVSPDFYDSVHEGDTIFVTGKEGRWSKRWYLENAYKKLPKKH